MILAESDLMSRYLNARVLCSDEDTPRTAGRRIRTFIRIDDVALCEFNRQEYPNLTPASKLRRGTVLMVPVHYPLLHRSLIARESGEYDEVHEDGDTEQEEDEGNLTKGELEGHTEAEHNEGHYNEAEGDMTLDKVADQDGERDAEVGEQNAKEGRPGGRGGGLKGGVRVAVKGVRRAGTQGVPFNASHAVLRKRHGSVRGVLRFGQMAVLAGALKEALGSRVVINCLDARHFGTVWGFRMWSDEYLIKLDNAVGALGEILEAGEVYSPIPCEHVMLLDRSLEVYRPEDEYLERDAPLCVKRTLTLEESRLVRALAPWQLVLTEKSPRALCVSSEIVGDEEEDAEGADSEKVEREERGGKGVGRGRRGRGRGRSTMVSAAGGGGDEVAEDELVFWPKLKYESSGRLLDMIPWYEWDKGVGGEAEREEDGEEATDYLKDERAIRLYDMIRNGFEDYTECGGGVGSSGNGEVAGGWEEEQSVFWADIREELYQGRMHMLHAGTLKLSGRTSLICIRPGPLQPFFLFC